MTKQIQTEDLHIWLAVIGEEAGAVIISRAQRPATRILGGKKRHSVIDCGKLNKQFHKIYYIFHAYLQTNMKLLYQFSCLLAIWMLNLNNVSQSPFYPIVPSCCNGHY